MKAIYKKRADIVNKLTKCESVEDFKKFVKNETNGKIYKKVIKNYYRESVGLEIVFYCDGYEFTFNTFQNEVFVVSPCGERNFGILYNENLANSLNKSELN